MNPSRKRALIIANQLYDDDRFDELPGAAGDARHLAKALQLPAVGEFDIQVVADENARAVRRAIEIFLKEADRDDLLLMHLSCHGKREDRTRELHFVARDTDFDHLAATGVSAQFINDRIEQTRSERVVLMLDCCYSGGFVKGMKQRAGNDHIEVGQHFQGKGRVVLTACSSLQYAFEATVLSLPKGEPSVFTSVVTQGLTTGLADIDMDGFISVNDLYKYVYQRVSALVPAQTPELSVDRLNGSLYLARNIRTLYMGSDTAPRLPMALQRAVLDGASWERFGATLGLERLLDDPQRDVRDAAREALVPLIRDADREVAERARQVWGSKVGTLIPISARPLARSDRGALGESRPITGRAIGIDFGTTNSTVAVLVDGKPVVVPNQLGKVLTPSVVGIHKGQVEVGEVAEQRASDAPANTVFAVKRELGTGWTRRVDDEEYSAENVAAFILDQLRRDAENYLGEPVSGAVITIPAYFGVVERAALRRASHLAGMDVFRLSNESTAAALAYTTAAADADKEHTVLVFDLGGGTLDVSVVEIGDGVVEVRATSGDDRLGGVDWDQRIVEWLVELAIANFRLDPVGDEFAMQSLRQAAERAKIELSTQEQTEVFLSYLGRVDGVPVHFRAKPSRAEFERRTSDLIDRCKEPVLRTLRDVAIKPAEIDGLVLVGGSAAIPAVLTLLEQLIGGTRPVASVDPRTAVAAGAALQAGILNGSFKDNLTLDVIPLSLGLESKGGAMTRIIHRNTSIPTKHAEIFTTAEDNQLSVKVQIFQGENDLTADNTRLGVFELTGLSPAPRGVPLIEITFDIDANGIVHVWARDIDSGQEAGMTLTGEVDGHADGGPIKPAVPRLGIRQRIEAKVSGHSHPSAAASG